MWVGLKSLDVLGWFASHCGEHSDARSAPPCTEKNQHAPSNYGLKSVVAIAVSVCYVRVCASAWLAALGVHSLNTVCRTQHQHAQSHKSLDSLSQQQSMSSAVLPPWLRTFSVMHRTVGVLWLNDGLPRDVLPSVALDSAAMCAP